MAERLGFRSVSMTLAVALALSGCVAQVPPIDARNLATRKSVQVRSTVSTATVVDSGAYTKGEATAGGAGAGAALGGQAVLGLAVDPNGAFLLFLYPALIPIAILGGAGLGAVAGNMAGSPHSREDLDRAEAALRKRFRPDAFAAQFQTGFTRTLQARLKPAGACVEGRGASRSCPRSRERARLSLRGAFYLLPSEEDNATSGHLDLVAGVAVHADPPGVVAPDCVGWLVRAPAGNLMVLAASDHSDFNHALGATVEDISIGVVNRLFADTAALAAAPEETEVPPLTEAQRRTGDWPKRVNRAEMRLIMSTHNGREKVRRGYYILDDARPEPGPSRDNPKRVNRAEMRLIMNTHNGREKVRRGYYVLDETRPDGPATPENPRRISRAEMLILQSTESGRKRLKRGDFVVEGAPPAGAAPKRVSARTSVRARTPTARATELVWTRQPCTVSPETGQANLPPVPVRSR